MNEFSLLSFTYRFLGASLVVFATFNPSGYSYFHWVSDSLQAGGPDFDAQRAFVGVVLLIGWTILIRSTLRSLGAFGLLLASAFIGTFVWLMTSYGMLTADTSISISWISLVCLAVLLAVGMSWSHIRRRLSGQIDVDEIGG